MNNSDAEFEKAKQCAFWYINRKRYTKKELIDKLLAKNYEYDLSECVINYLEELGYVDDKDYTRRYVCDAIKIKKQGPVRIKNDLLHKGIDSDIIDEELYKISDYSATLSELIKSKSKSINIYDIRQKNKLIGFLLRRGFKYGEIIDALKECNEGEY